MTDATTPVTSVNTPTPSASPKDLEALLAYIGPLFIYTMIKKGDSASHVWHAKNGAGLFVLSLGLVIAIQILWVLMPLSVLAMFGLIAWLFYLALGLASLFGAWQAWNGKQWTIPVVTNIGQKIPLEKWFHKGGMTAPVAMTSAPAPTPIEPTPAPVEPTPAPAPVASAPAPVEPTPAPTPVTPSEPSNPATPTV